jgi:hypothetical protein
MSDAFRAEVATNCTQNFYFFNFTQFKNILHCMETRPSGVEEERGRLLGGDRSAVARKESQRPRFLGPMCPVRTSEVNFSATEASCETWEMAGTETCVVCHLSELPFSSKNWKWRTALKAARSSLIDLGTMGLSGRQLGGEEGGGGHLELCTCWRTIPT